MNVQDLQKNNPIVLKKELAEKRDMLRELRFKMQSDELKNKHAIRNMRKVVARILTKLNAKK